MIGKILKVFGDSNEKQIGRYRWVVEKVGKLEDAMASLSDDRLAAKTGEFRERIAKGASLDDLLPEAFAVTREAAWRAIGLRHFDMQLIGGAVLHGGKVAEMKTGEGKTLVATLATYLNALSGRGAHVVTVNDYLARRDALWMGKVYTFLGLSVSCLQHEASYIVEPNREAAGGAPSGMRPVTRRDVYEADITYGNQQRVRVRLPARQHGDGPGPESAASVVLRHRRRGGQHPHRRGADSAHHQRSGAGASGALRRRGAGREAAERGKSTSIGTRRSGRSSSRPTGSRRSRRSSRSTTSTLTITAC